LYLVTEFSAWSKLVEQTKSLRDQIRGLVSASSASTPSTSLSSSVQAAVDAFVKTIQLAIQKTLLPDDSSSSSSSLTGEDGQTAAVTTETAEFQPKNLSATGPVVSELAVLQSTLSSLNLPSLLKASDKLLSELSASSSTSSSSSSSSHAVFSAIQPLLQQVRFFVFFFCSLSLLSSFSLLFFAVQFSVQAGG
jgi:hypothetical protein